MFPTSIVVDLLTRKHNKIFLESMIPLIPLLARTRYGGQVSMDAANWVAAGVREVIVNKRRMKHGCSRAMDPYVDGLCKEDLEIESVGLRCT